MSPSFTPAAIRSGAGTPDPRRGPVWTAGCETGYPACNHQSHRP